MTHSRSEGNESIKNFRLELNVGSSHNEEIKLTSAAMVTSYQWPVASGQWQAASGQLPAAFEVHS